MNVTIPVEAIPGIALLIGAIVSVVGMFTASGAGGAIPWMKSLLGVGVLTLIYAAFLIGTGVR